MRVSWLGIVPCSLVWLGLVTQDPVQHAQVLKQAQQLAVVVEPHQRLGKLVGQWTVTVQTTPPVGGEHKDSGQVVGKSILGGRYVVLDFHLKLRGHDLEAVQVLGFDTLRQLYTSSWRDNLSTWSVECCGPPKLDAPLVSSLRGMLADARDPAGRPFRLELDVSTENKVTVRTFDTQDGAESLVQVQEWTRR